MSQNRRVLVAGTGISGIVAARLVLERGDDVVLYDGNVALKEEDTKGEFDRGAKVNVTLGEIKCSNLLGVELCIISPGILFDSPFVSVVNDVKIPVLGEIGLAYQYGLGKLAAITGINGKTTTVALTGETLKARYGETFAVGSIGDPYTFEVLGMTGDSMTVAEVSSFQLETTMDFKPSVSAVLDITPDHLNRHDAMENYIRIEECTTLNQTKEDAVVLNYDDSALREFGQNPELKPRVIWFFGRETLKDGFCIDGDNIIYCQSGRQTVVANVHDMQLLGCHNHENAMAVAAIALEMGVPVSDITRVTEGFHPVEYRIGFVRERTGVRCYSDSKGTNPDVAIRALRTMPGPTFLIVGGYDENSEHDEWVSEFEGKVKYPVFIGQTKDEIVECVKKHGFTEIMYAGDMQEAVQMYAMYADIGDYVLLSPVYASWGMFRNYEERGRIFKECVMALQEVDAYDGKGANGSWTPWPDEVVSREQGPSETADAKEKEEGGAFS